MCMFIIDVSVCPAATLPVFEGAIKVMTERLILTPHVTASPQKGEL